LTWGQREQWDTLAANSPHGARFNLRFVADIPDGISVKQVADALAALFARHESMRTRFLVENGRLTLVVADRAGHRRR
jgi:hypothetical protein